MKTVLIVVGAIAASLLMLWLGVAAYTHAALHNAR
jgi:hypothetical protein